MSNGYPKTLGGIADKLHRMRAERLALEKRISDMRQKEQDLRIHALHQLNAGRIDSARGKLATISRVSHTVPTVKDWDAVYKFVRQHDALELFERRIHRQAWRDRVEEDGQIPGILPEEVVDVRVTSRRG